MIDPEYGRPGAAVVAILLLATMVALPIMVILLGVVALLELITMFIAFTAIVIFGQRAAPKNYPDGLKMALDWITSWEYSIGLVKLLGSRVN